MSVYINGIATLVPDSSYTQDFIRDFMIDHVADDRMTRLLIHRIYHQSGIGKRHTVIDEIDRAPDERTFFDSTNKHLKMPGTQKRNNLYIRKAKTMFPELARKTVEASSGFSEDDITHVITVSCTGFYAPGPDFDIVKSLGLPPGTQRFHIGFMGCYAFFPALKLAQSFCENDPNAVVLVVSLELCTLHLQLRKETDFLLSGSLFGDGGGGALISSHLPEKTDKILEIRLLSGSLAMDGESDMAWTIGDDGFNMILSTYVPGLLQSHIDETVQPLFRYTGLNKDEIDYWGIHPGGRAIVDKLQDELDIPDNKIESSRRVLHEYGNMSSATILFVLKDILEQKSEKTNSPVYAMAFGPGLTIESGLFLKNPLAVKSGRILKSAATNPVSPVSK